MSEFKTELNEYTLWFDGDIQVNPDNIENFILSGVNLDNLFVTEITKDIQFFNNNSVNKIKIKDEIDPFKIDFEWQIPIEYKNIDIEKYVTDCFYTKKHNVCDKRLKRLQYELEQFKSRNLFPVLQTLIYILDIFKKNNTPWGVGRGSSCASYCLYLIGLHLVDPVKYNIDISEFLK